MLFPPKKAILYHGKIGEEYRPFGVFSNPKGSIKIVQSTSRFEYFTLRIGFWKLFFRKGLV